LSAGLSFWRINTEFLPPIDLGQIGVRTRLELSTALASVRSLRLGNVSKRLIAKSIATTG
jgi:hypothetical protein